MDEDRLKAKLEELFELQVKRDVLGLDQQKLIDEAMPPEVREAIQGIKAEIGPKMEAVSEAIAELEQDVKAAVLAHGASVKTEHLHAIVNKGRVRWDTRGLGGYAVAHPEIEAFRTTGKPSVSLRKR